MSFVTPLISILCFACSNCTELQAKEETIHVDRQTSIVDLHISVTNCSDTDFLYYNLKGIPLQGVPEELLFNDKGSVSFYFNIYDSSNLRMIRPTESVHDSINYQSLDKLKNHLLMASFQLREQKVVIQRGMSFNHVMRIDLRNYHLKKGIYKIHLVYRSGKGITNEIDEQDIKEDERNEKATCFKGWMKSKIITLTVD